MMMICLSNDDVFYDTDCLSSFLIVNQTDILEKLFSNIIVPKNVRDELMHVATPPSIKNRYKNLEDKGFIIVNDLKVGSDEFKLYEKLINSHIFDYKKPIGDGEAASISLAFIKGGILASNNINDVYPYVKRFDLKWISTSFILAKAYEKGIMTIEDLDKIYIEMKKRKRKLPSNSFTDYYFGKYLQDKEDMTSL